MRPSRLLTSIALAAAAQFLCWLAAAQSVTQPSGYPFSVQSTATPISASNVSASTTISATYPLTQVQNTTNSLACVAWGTSPTAAYPCPPNQQLPAGQVGVFPTVGATSIAAVLGVAAATGSLAVTQGYLSPVSSSTPAGTVTANQGGAPWSVYNAQSTPAAPDVSTVITGGTPATAFAAGHCAKGCYVTNPDNAAVNLCANGVGTASGTHSNGATVCAVPGQSITFTPRSGAISVVSSDSGHAFGGEGYQ